MKDSSSRGSSRTQIGGGSSPPARAARSATPPSEYGVLPARHPKPPPGSVMSRADASVSPRNDELSATAAARRGGVSARRRGLEGRRARAAEGLHEPPDARRLRHGGAAADDDHPGLDRAAAGARGGVRALPLPRRGPGAPAPARANGDR